MLRALTVLLICWLGSVHAAALKVGDTLPAGLLFCDVIASSETNTDRIDLASLVGAPLYLDIWASWCAPCRQSFPWMEQQQQAFADKGLRIIAISIDNNTKEIKRFIKKNPTALMIAHDKNKVLPKTFQIPAMPTSIFIDRLGTVRHIHGGFTSADTDTLRSWMETITQ